MINVPMAFLYSVGLYVLVSLVVAGMLVLVEHKTWGSAMRRGFAIVLVVLSVCALFIALLTALVHSLGGSVFP